jgi:hypothetical protein
MATETSFKRTLTEGNRCSSIAAAAKYIDDTEDVLVLQDREIAAIIDAAALLPGPLWNGHGWPPNQATRGIEI